ncbi:MAG: hypothetical protein JW963_21300 [Anaerolineales bacterium]|nr:hypothetical protein [Anaerolineales bacterium]
MADRSPRLGVSVNEEFHEALQKESTKSGLTISQMVRIAIENYMRERGYDIAASVEWGGWRGGPKEDREDGGNESESDPVAYAVG